MAKGITITETLEDGSVNTDTQEVADAKNVFVKYIDENQSEVFYLNAENEMISLGVKAGVVSVSFGELTEAQPQQEPQKKETKKSKKKK